MEKPFPYSKSVTFQKPQEKEVLYWEVMPLKIWVLEVYIDCNIIVL
nr:hypothetical protein [Kaistella flava (ex Peng et al. 2021)]